MTMSDDYFAKPPCRRKPGTAGPAARSIVHLRVSDSGAISLCGLDRFPVTLARDQWLHLLGMSEQIRAFIDANEGRLKPGA